MVSLNQIVSRINEVADEHYMLKTFQCGNLSQIAEIDSQDNLVYPLAYLDRRSASSTGGAFFFNFDLIITDLVKTDRSNEQEVISDCMQIAQDFAVLLERPEYLNISDTAWLNPTQTINYSIISEEYSDRVAGVVMSFQIKQAFTYNRCVTPVTGNSNCQSAPTCTDTINSLGADYYDCVLPSYDFTTSRVQNAVTAQQQTDLIAWLCVSGTSTVENSDQSYQTTVDSGDTLVLPDITITKQDASTISFPSVQDVDIRTYASGIAYQRPMVAIQSTSYNLYDAGWRLANTVRPSQPPYPISYAELDWTALNPFITLKENNAFGNKNRWTDELGTQAYATNYAIDHLTGYGIALITPVTANWATALSNINSLTHATFSDYFMPTLDEFNSVCDMELTDAINYSPLSNFSIVSGSDIWTGNTDALTTSNAQTVQPQLGGGNAYNMRRLSKASSGYYLPMRYHY